MLQKTFINRANGTAALHNIYTPTRVVNALDSRTDTNTHEEKKFTYVSWEMYGKEPVRRPSADGGMIMMMTMMMIL